MVHGFGDIKQMNIHIGDPQVPKPTTSGIEIATEMFKMFKSPGTYHIPAEQIQARGETLHSEILSSLILFRIMKTCLSSGSSLLLYLLTRMEIKLTITRISVRNFKQNVTQYSSLKIKSTPRRNYWESSV
jgi:hypothetical protein